MSNRQRLFWMRAANCGIAFLRIAWVVFLALWKILIVGIAVASAMGQDRGRRGRGRGRGGLKTYRGVFVGRHGARPYGGLYLPVKGFGAIGVGRRGAWAKFNPRRR